MGPVKQYLFGGDRPWDVSQFTASDDRVRGGKSQSYLTVVSSGPGPVSTAEFSGNLDIKTLGGAGFASQRTVDDIPAWDLSAFDTLVLDIERADGKKYTVTLKDETLPKRPDGREQSSISWEYDFVPGGRGGSSGSGSVTEGTGSSGPVVISFTAFQPTYRGKPKPDAKPLDLKGVKRISFMMRSFFGEQEGDFSLVLKSVSAEKREETNPITPSRDTSLDSVASGKLPMRGDKRQEDIGRHAGTGGFGFTSWIGKLCGWNM